MPKDSQNGISRELFSLLSWRSWLCNVTPTVIFRTTCKLRLGSRFCSAEGADLPPACCPQTNDIRWDLTSVTAGACPAAEPCVRTHRAPLTSAQRAGGARRKTLTAGSSRRAAGTHPRTRLRGAPPAAQRERARRATRSAVTGGGRRTQGRAARRINGDGWRSSARLNPTLRQIPATNAVTAGPQPHPRLLGAAARVLPGPLPTPGDTERPGHRSHRAPLRLPSGSAAPARQPASRPPTRGQPRLGRDARCLPTRGSGVAEQLRGTPEPEAAAAGGARWEEGGRERRRGAAGRCKWLNAKARAAQKLRSPRGPRRARPLCFPAQWRAHTHGAGGRGSPGADLLRVAGSAEKSRCRGGNRTAAAAGRGARRPRGGEAGTAPPGRAEGNSPAEAPSGGDGVGGRLAAL